MKALSDSNRYVMYVRKSSESEDRQVQSTDDQKKWLKQRASELGLTITHILKEERSAKKPNSRPVFEEMLQLIECGKADGILCWQINRLSRNPIDSARIQWMLQEGTIQSVVTAQKEYLPSDNAILFSVESGMANQFIIELRANTRRGLASKIEKGWFPGLAPLGYLNEKEADKGEKRILVDSERWHEVRRIWDLMLTGHYNPRQILQVVTDEGLRTRRTKHQGGGPITQSGIYKILNNSFYTGAFTLAGQEFAGKHQAMISKDEFERVQALLGAKGRPKPKTREFSYTGLMKCGECGCLVTAETKNKLVKATGQIAAYTYYRCTKRKRGTSCSQRPIRLADIESQVLHELSRFAIAPEFKNWALKILEEENRREFGLRAKKHRLLGKQVRQLEVELYDLNKTYTRGKLDEDFYTLEKNKLKQEIAQAEVQLNQSQHAADKHIELSENVFKFACHAAETFVHADVRTRREIFSALGGSFLLTDGVITYQPEAWFLKISETYPELEKKLERVRTERFGNIYLEFVQIAGILKTWGHVVKSIRTLQRFGSA